ncbi:DUF805 domain-containing protein [Maritimibacter sp. DP1N21-5]|uniref:DUF805 domain-containing protein n=1 Tax=Maritimibacter sp. DP1N21-5 TaxID=2836867 RepID=UPI001C46706C|nr:DUF805 domain-containing protein [Maritimibacter sp. DP1N21-5]MBV7407620.1 DUF805 domain-containing protein [Maritimibacter sp. DP1N21-5]
MNMMEAVRAVFSKYAVFKGRSRRAELWWFVLFCFIVNIVLGVVDSVLFGTTTETGSLATGDYNFSSSTDTPILSMIFGLATLIPSIAVGVRRLHDINKSGWWILIGLIPLIGIIILIVWYAKAGDKGGNRFGPDPIDGAGGGGGYAPSSVPPVA